MLSSVHHIIVDNVRLHISRRELADDPPALRRVRGLVFRSTPPKQKSRRSHLQKAKSLDEVNEYSTKQQPRSARRRRRASVTLLCRAKSWEDLNEPDYYPAEEDTVPFVGNSRDEFNMDRSDSDSSRSLVYRRRASVGYSSSSTDRGQQLEVTADTVPRRPRRSSCMGNTPVPVASSSHKPYDAGAASLGDFSGSRKNNDFRPIRPRRSSLAMYETGTRDEQETPWSQTRCDSSPTMPTRSHANQRFVSNDKDALGKPEFPTKPVRSSDDPALLSPALEQGNVCFPAQA